MRDKGYDILKKQDYEEDDPWPAHTGRLSIIMNKITGFITNKKWTPATQ